MLSIHCKIINQFNSARAVFRIEKRNGAFYKRFVIIKPHELYSEDVFTAISLSEDKFNMFPVIVWTEVLLVVIVSGKIKKRNEGVKEIQKKPSTLDTDI